MIRIRAMIYIPGKIMIGLTFPNDEVEDKIPYMTMMESHDFTADYSYPLIQATCTNSDRFRGYYEGLK